MNIFLSYRRNRGGVYADRIHNFFAEYDVKIFYDIQAFRSHAGEFTDKLKTHILEADDFILLLTEDCFKIEEGSGRVFIQEIETALDAGKRIIPIRIGQFRFDENLPQSLERLPQLESLELKDMQHIDQFFIDLLRKLTRTKEISRILQDVLWYTKLKSRSAIEAKDTLKHRLSDDVVSVDVCAMACQGLLAHGREHLVRLAKNQAKFRIVINDPKSPAAKEACSMKISSGSEKIRKGIIKESYQYMLGWIESYPEAFECRLTKFYLPCAIFIVRYRDPARNTIKVDYYSFDCPDGERRCVCIKATDTENYEFYEKQFQFIWDNAAPVALETGVEEK